MYIKKITLQNFKSFVNKTFDFCAPDGVNDGSGLNIFVGENNSGKSTVFEAIDFLRNYTKVSLEQLKRKHCTGDDELFVEVEFSGNVEGVIMGFSDKDLGDFVFEENGTKILRARRSDKIYSIIQEKKTVEMNPKKIGLWNFKTGQFENPGGIDADFKKLFEIDFIWADTNPDEIVRFGATTICGKLLEEIAKSFVTTDEYRRFSEAHQEAFNGLNSPLKQGLDKVEKRTREIFKDQFGDAEIKFHFDSIDATSFFKNTKIKINDGLETYLEEKGNGMQRSVAIALLQAYAEELVKNTKAESISKPFYLFIDEPEICLHPQAQKKLAAALKVLTKTKQVFIATHSPYFINPDLIGNIFRFENKGGDIGADVSICNITETIEKLKEKENRIFFFHHRDLFFTKRAFFFEGADDYERYSLFCEKNGLSDLIQDFYFLAGKNDWNHFKKMCDSLGIATKFIFDLDVLFKNVTMGFDKNAQEKIRSLGKTFKPDPANPQKGHPDKTQRCEPLFDEVLTSSELTLKNELLGSLDKQGIFILRHGMIENYLDQNGDIIESANKVDKEIELKKLFGDAS